MLNKKIKHAEQRTKAATMGQRIRQLRKAKLLTQDDVALQLGVSKAAVSQWESGISENIKIQTFLRLCAMLEIDAQHLAFGDLPMSREHSPVAVSRAKITQ